MIPLNDTQEESPSKAAATIDFPSEKIWLCNA
jgi:hypothetical protein